MSHYATFMALVRQDMTCRRNPRPVDHRLAWRWSGLVTNAVIWVALVTWQGPHIHFSLNYYWLAMLALPIMAVTSARRQITQERENGTVGWWISLPLSRWQLLLSKWISSLVLTVLSASYLLIIAGVGIYTMVLNHTFSLPVVSQFLLQGLIGLTICFGLMLPTTAFGILLGTIQYSPWRFLQTPIRLLLIAWAWLLLQQYHWFLRVRPPFYVTLHATSAIAVFVFLALAGLVLWISATTLDRYPIA
jgi:ABC-type Na+ efflux pump permease subunit